MLQSIYEWFASSKGPQPCDVIFALAGRQSRKQEGLKLFADGLAPILLLSTGRFEIRGFSGLPLPRQVGLAGLAKNTPPPERHYFVVFERERVQAEKIRVGRWGTWSEIEALAEWLQRRSGVRSVTIITSGYHMRRVRLCCARLLAPGVTLNFLSISDGENGFDGKRGWRQSDLRKMLALEAIKLLFYGAALRGTSRGAC